LRCCPEGLALLLTGCAVSPLAARAPALPPCAAAPVDLDLTLAVRLVVGPDITAEAARNLLADGAGALAPWGVRLVVVEEARADAAAAIGGGGDPLDPVHALIIGFGAPGSQHDALVVVVLPHVIDPASPEARGHTLNGLTFAPAGEPLAASIQAQLGVRAPFAPLIVLGKRELDALDPPVAGAIVAHELGHALGLAHTGTPESLMNPALPTCGGALSPAEQSTLRASAKSFLRAGGLLALLGGCHPVEPDVCAAEATLAAGLGASAFGVMEEGGAVPYELGPQGGFHVWGALHATGIVPGNPDRYDDPDNPIVTFVLQGEDGPLGGFAGLPVVFNADGEAFGIQLFLSFTADDTTPGTPVALTAELDDACGRHVVADPVNGTLQPAL
jgi:hypothetical protein